MIQGLEQHITESLNSRQTPDWFNRLRTESLSRFNKLGIPTVKDEDWKYTSLAALTKHTFKVAEDNELIESEALKNYLNTSEINIVLVNGILSTELSTLSNVPGGITISTLDDAITNKAPNIQELLAKYNENNDAAFIALNEALSGSGTYIQIDAGIASEKLIHIIHVTSSRHKNTASMPRTLITTGESSEATILESHVSFNDTLAYFSNALTDIFLSENATLHYCKSQKESLKAFHIGHTRVWQKGNSNFDGFSFMAGSALTRNDLDIILNGEGANASLNALYSAYNNQHIDNHTSVDHRVPNCTSTQFYKGILNNAARAVFNGKVIVQPVAQNTNSYQLNKNLLLGTDCRIDTKPQLEIFADDVKCTHGATIGQLDKDEMFYLQTRCIPKRAAIKILAHGFVNDLFSTIKSTTIRERLNKLMEPSFEALQ
jgi:Fe-S cluster assembly protein SufD